MSHPRKAPHRRLGARGARAKQVVGAAPITLLCARLGVPRGQAVGDGAPLGMPGGASAWIDRDSGVGGGLIVSVGGGRIAGVSAALRELLVRHVDVGTIPGGVALLGAGNARVITAGMASVGSGPMGEDAIMRIQSMTKAITSVAALRLVEAGRLELDQSLVDWNFRSRSSRERGGAITIRLACSASSSPG
jgi:CubicO group peptidase (beta-lactamase class C family)